MSRLGIKTVAGFLNLVVMLGLSLFLPAGSLDFWEAWAYMIVFFVPVLLITAYFVRADPSLIQRRLKAGPFAEKRGRQKTVQWAASLIFLLIYITGGLDHRFRWTEVPTVLVIAGEVVVALGFWIVFLVFKENRHTSAAVEIDKDQRVVTTGPYAVVRHPMYSGALLLLMATPVALGSWWALLPASAMVPIIILRLFDEENLLRRDLPGYVDYCRTIRRRLVPHIW